LGCRVLGSGIIVHGVWFRVSGLGIRDYPAHGEGAVEPVFTYATTPTETPFYHHESISTLNIFPPAGWENGGTEVSPEP